MKIIYLTTSIEENDFREFSSHWNVPLNPSNQNFHNKFIRALSKENTLDVISVRPFSRKNCRLKKLKAEEKEQGNIRWHYLKVSGGRILKRLSFYRQVKALSKALDLENSVILTDTINPNVSTMARYMKRKHNATVIGICTDSPSNISFTSKAYSQYILRMSSGFDGYIALTEELNNHFNPDGKASLILEGIVEDSLPEKGENKYGNYVFFGGALMERYGIYSLIKSFKKLAEPGLKLVLCGHHADEKKLSDAIGGQPEILYLGIQPVNEVLKLEQNALVCVNPRPYSQDLDRFSIPSKTLEYLSSGVPVISVKNTILQDKFPEEILWSPSSSPEDLENSLRDVLSMNPSERALLGRSARSKVLSLYSFPVVSGKVSEFLRSFGKQD